MPDTRIESGELNREMVLEHDIGTGTDSAGQHVEDWQPYGSVPTRWVGLEQLSGREIERAAMLNVEATHKIQMYWMPGVSAVKFRGVMGSRVFNFGIVNDVNDAHIKLEIIACERIA